jgi:hypothetical protein
MNEERWWDGSSLDFSSLQTLCTGGAAEDSPQFQLRESEAIRNSPGGAADFI